jgi:hypothetical protein
MCEPDQRLGEDGWGRRGEESGDRSELGIRSRSLGK